MSEEDSSPTDLNHQFLLIEGTDFTRPIYGSGNATVVSSLMRGFAGQISLVGITTDAHEIGKWTEVEAFGKIYPFLPIISAARIRNPFTKSSNLDLAIGLFRHRKALSDVGINRIFTRTYTILWALNMMKPIWDVCFFYPGLGNPMLIGRKSKYTRYFAGFYERKQARALHKNVTVAYAAASNEVIDNYNNYIAMRGVTCRVEPLATAVDPNEVRPFPMADARISLDIAEDDLVLCFVGRLAIVKGIDLLLNAVAQIKEMQDRKVTFLIVGDGELRSKLAEDAKVLGLEGDVRFLGMLPKPDVVQAIAAADVCVVGSLVEGFSNAMLEQLAVGKPIVSTAVSGAANIISNGVNGFVVETRDSKNFAEKVIRAAALLNVETYNGAIVAKKYSEESLWRRITDEWLM